MTNRGMLRIAWWVGLTVFAAVVLASLVRHPDMYGLGMLFVVALLVLSQVTRWWR